MSTLIIQKVNVTISFRVPGFLKIICDLSYNFVLMLYASQQVIFFSDLYQKNLCRKLSFNFLFLSIGIIRYWYVSTSLVMYIFFKCLYSLWDQIKKRKLPKYG